MSRTKKILIAVGALIIIGGVYAYKEYTRKNKDLANTSADVKISSKELLFQFEQNEKAANKQFLDKVIQVDGKVKEVIKDEKGFYTIVLANGNELSSVRCSMDTTHQDAAATIINGNIISVKGMCTGFNADELLGSDVILNRCVVANKK